MMDNNKGLSASRWANGQRLPIPKLSSSRGSSPSEASIRAPSPTKTNSNQPVCNESQLARFLKMAKRLKWKMPFLELGYAKATSRAGLSLQDVEENEIHFKLDYYEYYTLLEGALVSLLSVYGVAIDRYANSAGATRTHSVEPSARSPDRTENRAHRYHHNVIAALESPATPLSTIFGNALVHKQLIRAKELRNRWKYIEEDERRLPPPPLESYNLDEILQTVQAAIEHGHEMARKDVEEYIAREGKADQSTDEGWDFMVNAMDWEETRM